MNVRWIFIPFGFAIAMSVSQAQLPALVQLPTFPSSGGVELRGTLDGLLTAKSLADVGDLNGDGIHDLAVGQPDAQLGTMTNAGSVIVVFGGSTLLASPVLDPTQLNGSNGFMVLGADRSDRTGTALAAAGDFNGDSYGDLLIGAPGACVGPGNTTGNSKGVTYVIFGGPNIGSGGTLALATLSPAQGLQIEGGDFGDGAGSSIAGVGDVDADGIDDVLIGAPDTGTRVTVSWIGNDIARTDSGDVDNDGDIDLIVTNPGDGRFLILFNEGGGQYTFTPLAIASYPRDVFLRDIDSDGDLDIVLGNEAAAGGRITIRFNLGGGAFGPQIHYALPEHSVRVVPADVDGDLDIDLVATDWENSGSPGLGHEMRVLLNNGAGVFTMSASLPAPRMPLHLLAIDFTLDGKPDFAVFDSTTSTTLLYANNGSGVLSYVSSVATNYSSGLGAADLDGDGDEDMINAYGLKVYKNLGNGTFGPAQSIGGQPSRHYSDLRCGDMDGDGDLDIVAIEDSMSLDLVVVIKNRGNWNFSPMAGFPVDLVTRGWAVSLADLDGDQDLDVFAGYSVGNSGDVSMMENRGDGSLVGGWCGKSFLVRGTATPPPSGALSLGSLNGASGFAMTGLAGNDHFGSSVAGCGDIDQDGFQDFAVGAVGRDQLATDGGTVYVVRGGPGLGSTGTIDLASLAGPSGFAISGDVDVRFLGMKLAGNGDVSGDGKPDLAIGGDNVGPTFYEAGSVTVVYGAPGLGSSGLIASSTLGGANGFAVLGSVSNLRLGEGLAIGGDVNGDGFGDLAIGSPYAGLPATNAGSAYLIYGHPGVGEQGVVQVDPADGVRRCEVRGSSSNCYAGMTLAMVGDQDQDGKDELLVGAPGDSSYPNQQFRGKAFLILGDALPQATTFCTAKVNSLGCLPNIFASGTASASSPQACLIRANNVRNQKPGLMLFSTAGPANTPFAGGILCLAPAVRRTGGQSAGGTPAGTDDCSGTYSFNLNADIQGGSHPQLVPGVVIFMQYWSRDPGFPAPDNAGLTAGLQMTIGV